jgi:hypothetical protein
MDYHIKDFELGGVSFGRPGDWRDLLKGLFAYNTFWESEASEIYEAG